MLGMKDLKMFNIRTEQDVRDFAHYVIFDLKCCYHPDDSFGDIIDENNDQMFEPRAVRYLDRVNDQCFDVVGDKYYNICMAEAESFARANGSSL